MNEYEPIERKGNESYSGQPKGHGPSVPPPDQGSRSCGGSQSPHVLARMPDLDADMEMEPEMPRRHRSSRRPKKSAPPVLLMIGGAVVVLAVAAIPFLLTRKESSDSSTREEVAWQPETTGSNAPSAPAWGGATTDAGNWQNTGGASGYTPPGQYQAPSWNSSAQPPAWVSPPQAPSTNGRPETADWNNTPQPPAPTTAPAWSSQESQTSIPASGSSYPNPSTVNGSQAPSWNNTPYAGPVISGQAQPVDPSGSYSAQPAAPEAAPAWANTTPAWANVPPSPSASLDAASPWGNPPQTAAAREPAPSWNSPSTPMPGARNPMSGPVTPVQPAIPSWGEPSPSPALANEQPMMPPTAYGLGTAGAASPAYSGAYQPPQTSALNQMPYGSNSRVTTGPPAAGVPSYPGYPQNAPAVYGADPSAGAAAVAQRYDQSAPAQNAQNALPAYLRNDPLYRADPATMYGQNNGAPSGQQNAYPGPYPPANQPVGAGPTGATYPAPAYGTGAPVYGPAGPAGYADPGMGRLTGGIEKPTVGSNYDGTRSSLY